MPTQHDSLPKSGLLHTAPHLHLTGELCPLCDQPIALDRRDEINERIELRERERSAEITARIAEQHAKEKAQAIEQVRQQAALTLQQERQSVEAKLLAVRNEERTAAEKANHDSQVALQKRVDAAEEAKGESLALRESLQNELAEVKRTSQALLAQVREEFAANEAKVRAEAARAAQAGMQQQVADAQVANMTLQAQLKEMRSQHEATLEAMKVDAEAEAAKMREEVAITVMNAADEKIAVAQRSGVEAIARAAAAEQQLRSVQQNYENNLAQRLQEQRDALEQAKTDAVNAERSTAFEEKLKLSSKLDDLQRALDRRTAEELGEGAELNLLECLKEEFEHDRFEPVNRGKPGADILHTVIHNGKCCGTIIYDSKNHSGWRYEHVTKLAADQMAAKAEYAILSTRKFPSGKQHLHVHDGVMLASPARVVALVQIVRQHLIQTSTLRLSNEERTEKTAALYSFITSERCADLLTRVDTHAEDLLELQVKEKKAHDLTWKKQGELVRSVQKVRAELCSEIDEIIGTRCASATMAS
jgi:hypothetical protein